MQEGIHYRALRWDVERDCLISYLSMIFFLFFFGSTNELITFSDILLLHKNSMGILFNDAKSYLYTFGLEEGLETTLD